MRWCEDAVPPAFFVCFAQRMAKPTGLFSGNREGEGRGEGGREGGRESGKGRDEHEQPRWRQFGADGGTD